MTWEGAPGYSISDLLKEENNLVPIITFNQEIDNILGGGIFPHKITEIFGDKGVGKTTICCQLALDVQIPISLGGLEAECIYIDTENTFVRKRVHSMAEKLVEHCSNIEPSLTITIDSLLNGIHYIQCGTSEDLLQILDDLHRYILSNSKLKLVVIDSLAFLFYTGSEQFHQRGKVMYEISQRLSQLVSQHRLAVVLTNNMTTRFSDFGNQYRIPFLGETWTHIPNVRLHLELEGDSRVARLIKGPVRPIDSAVYRVIEAGIRK